MKQPKKMKLGIGDKYFAFGRSSNVIAPVIFKTKHSVDEIRNAARYLLTIYPKLRSVIVPTLFSYKYEILDDKSEGLSALFNYAFRIIPKVKYKTNEYNELERYIFNEPFSLTTTIPVKFYYLPESKSLIILFHHAIGDGMSVINMLESLMSYLNGTKPPLEKPYNPSFLSMFTDNLLKIPVYIFSSLWQTIKDPATIFGKVKGNVLQLSDKQITYHGQCDLIHHEIACNFGALKDKSKDSKTTISVLLVVALVTALYRLRKNKKTNLIRLQIPISIRHNFKKQPTFGNYAYVIVINVFRDFWDEPKKLIEAVHSQFSNMMDIINKKKLFIPFFGLSLMSKIMGPKTLLRIANNILKKRPFNFSMSFANLMNIDVINSYGKNAQVAEVFFTTTQSEPFFDFHTLNNKMYLTCSFQESIYTREEITQFIKAFEKSLGELLKMKAQ